MPKKFIFKNQNFRESFNYLLAITIISALFFIPLYLLKKSKDSSKGFLEVNLTETKDTKPIISLEGSRNLNLSIKGKIKGNVNPEEIPKIIIKIYEDDRLIKAIAPNFKLEFNLSIKVNPNSVITLKPESKNYVFFPKNQDIKTNDKDSNLNIEFDSSPSKTTAQNLQIKGKIEGSKTGETLVYLIGFSVVKKREVKKVTKVNPKGEFIFGNIDSGTYIVIPYNKNSYFIPKSKELHLKNSNKKVFFWSVRKLY